MSIEGLWHSYYEYGKGPRDEPLSSQHGIRFVREGDAWVGKSPPNKEGSILILKLTTKDNAEFRGTWHERTSPTGYYQGRDFEGLILFRLSESDTELNGMWLGAGSSSGRVKSGVWKLSRKE